MDSILMQSIVLAILALVANFDFLSGGTMISRPIVTGLLTGLVMGDITQGIIIGATLELAFMGTFSIGAVIPPDTISGAILGTAFAISSGAGPAVALTLALPISTLVMLLKNLIHVFILPLFVNKADKYAEEGNSKGITTINIVGGFVYVGLSIVASVGFGYYFGSDLISQLLDTIPSFILTGLQIATGILPAYGLALLAEPIINKKNIIFFIVGFAISGYLGIPIPGIAVFGLATALVLTGFSNPYIGKSITVESVNENEGGKDYDSEEF